MIVEKCLSGGFLISEFDKGGSLFKMRFMDCTLRDAKKTFKSELKSHNGRFVVERKAVKPCK